MENLNQEIINENNYENEGNSKKVHTIGGYRTTVKTADHEHQEHSFDIPMDISMVTGVTETSETRLSDLNEECLETIFSLKFISIKDLCAVARTNHRLMNIANRQFSLNYKTCYIMSLVNSISDAKRVIVTFGFLISDLRVCEYEDAGNQDKAQWTNEDWFSLLNLVIRCCSETLYTLVIDQLLIPKSLTSGLKKLFSNLQKLRFYNCRFQRSDDLFVDCKQLVELTVQNSSNVTQEALNVRFAMDTVFPKLERFRYDMGDWVDLANFLPRHKHLKRLGIWDCRDSFALLPIIAINCNNLEELKIYISILTDKYGEVIESLQMLVHLRKLTLFCNQENITESIPKLNSLKSLEFLQLCDVTADSEFTSALSQLKKLQVLRLMKCDGLVNLNRLADITQLTELSIWSMNINLDIVLLVKQLNSLKTLKIFDPTYGLDKKIYLNLVTVVLNRPIRSQQSLKITCFIADSWTSNNLARQAASSSSESNRILVSRDVRRVYKCLIERSIVREFHHIWPIIISSSDFSQSSRNIEIHTADPRDFHNNQKYKHLKMTRLLNHLKVLAYAFECKLIFDLNL